MGMNPERGTTASGQNQAATRPNQHLCGIGWWTPDWLQHFATRKSYGVVFCLFSLCQGLFFTYVLSVLSTMEKRFAFPSKLSGFIITGTEFSPILLGILLAHYGNQGHRPKWLATTGFIAAVGCLVTAIPEFLFPRTLNISADNTTSSFKNDLCSLISVSAVTTGKTASASPAHSSSYIAASVLFLGLFAFGVGSSTRWSLGYPYLDDNVQKRNTPAFIGFSVGLSIVGPALGYMLGGACLSYYTDLTVTPEFGPEDPQWVGAWWMGMIIVGLCNAITSFLVLLFPRQLPQTLAKAQEIEEKEQIQHDTTINQLRELFKTLSRVLRNELYLIYILRATISVLGILGFLTFLPKYLESQFRQSAAVANYYTGMTGILIMVFGYIASGLVIQRLQPSARAVCGYSVAMLLLQALCFLGLTQVGCGGRATLQGEFTHGGRALNLREDCNVACNCTTEKFAPVCDLGQHQTFFSACYFGCQSYNETTQRYSSCGCSSRGRAVGDPEVVGGWCSSTCPSLLWYIVLVCLMRVLNSTEHVGEMLIIFRITDKKDQSVALSFFYAFIAIFGFIPCPVVYGAIVDSTCLIWNESQSSTSNCWLYDTNRLNYLFHGASSALVLLSAILQAYLCYKVKDLKLYEENQSSMEMVTQDNKGQRQQD